MMAHLAHPDMHFAFPVVRKKAGRDVVCDEFLPQWREMLGRNPYADLQEWMRVIDAGNQQPQIYVRESDEIQRKLSLKASQGGYKVMLIWLPEKMNVECANKLLKLLEEPPLKTVFLLVSEEPDLLLPTIVSRTQRINLKPLPESDIERYLVERYMLPVEDARDIAHRSAGSLLRAVENVHLGEENKLCFELFVNLMRTAYMLILNLFNFGNIAGYWVKGRTTEIFVRKMVGAADINIFKKLIIDFSIATGLFIFAGMLIGAIIIGVYIKIVGEIALFGVINCTIQWLILILFGGIFIWKQVRKTMTQLRKQN